MIILMTVDFVFVMGLLNMNMTLDVSFVTLLDENAIKAYLEENKKPIWRESKEKPERVKWLKKQCTDLYREK